jgi:carbamoylphosphate synthase small subunit
LRRFFIGDESAYENDAGTGRWKFFSGESFGAEAEVCGWVHNDYVVVGYQETLTDPDNLGMLVNMTYPLIGNYGVNAERGKQCEDDSRVSQRN